MIDRALDAWRAWRDRVGRPAKVIINVAAAVIYLTAYLGLREASNDQWYLPAGLRFATLLVAPYRLWPALFVGETAAILSLGFNKLPSYGWAYYLGSAVTSWPVAALIVRQARRATALPRVVKATDAVTLIIGGVLCAEVVSLLNKAASAYLKPGARAFTPSDLLAYSLGDVQGILLATLVVGLVTRWLQTRAVSRAFMVDACFAALVNIALLGMIDFAAIDDANALMALRLCMLLPALAMTFRHGWTGAAVGTIAANLALFATIPHQAAGDVNGPGLLMQEAFVLVAASLFVLGARMQPASEASTSGADTPCDRHQDREHFEAQERRHRDAALRAEAMQRDSRESMRPVISLLRKHGQAEAALSLVGMAHTRSSQFERQVIDSIYPLTLERYGLFTAVESEAFTARFGSTPHRLDLTGSPHGLGLGTALAAYRALGEAIDHLEQAMPASISVRIHCAVKADGRGIVSMSVRAIAPAALGRSAAQTARLAQLRNRAMAYGGSLHNRAHRLRLIVLDDAIQTAAAAAPASAAVCNVQSLHAPALAH
jgi:Signal transduction histidine kinase, glucose-6-phosphate specific